MSRVTFTHNLQRHIPSPPAEVSGATLGQALEQVFSDNPRLRGYILDDQGGIREHMTIFINGEPARDRRTLCDPIDEKTEIFVMQALSGG